MCNSINDFGSVEVRLNEIKTKHSLTKLSQVSGGYALYVWSKFDQNFAVLDFCYTFPGVGGLGKSRIITISVQLTLKLGLSLAIKISMFSHEVGSKFIRFDLVLLLNLGPTWEPGKVLSHFCRGYMHFAEAICLFSQRLYAFCRGYMQFGRGYMQ